jgi:ABC-type Mn2+/Zn2+ transport system permease subunit
MFELEFMRLALVASIAAGASLGTIGVYLLIRRVVFFGLVIASVTTVGAAIAQTAGLSTEIPSLAAAVAATLLLGGHGASRWVSAEAMMGWAYAAASAATVLLLAVSSGGSTDTFHILFGNVLTVDRPHVIVLSVIALVVVLIQALFGRRFLLITFDVEAASVAGVNTRAWSFALHLLTGIAVATAVEHIGVLSTFALLTLPSLAALLLTRSMRATFILAAGLAIAVSSLALVVSFHLDLPAGPTTVGLLALVVPIAALGRRIIGGAEPGR